jgi:hypothetical protein
LSRKIKAEKAVVFTDLDDDTGVLLHLENKFYYSLNLTGSFIWRLLEDKQELSEDVILEAILDNFDVSSDEAKSDVNEFIEDLTKEGLIKIL